MSDTEKSPSHHNKIVITITDGLPTLSYNDDGYVWGSGFHAQSEEMIGQHISYTLTEAEKLKAKYDLYSMGIGLYEHQEDNELVVKGLSSSEEDAYFVNSVEEITTALNEITDKLNKNSIRLGYIEDPIPDEFNINSGSDFKEASNDLLTDGDYFVIGDDTLTENIEVSVEGKTLKVTGLNLGQDNEITVRYKLQIDTTRDGIKPTELYETNGPATLTPLRNDETVTYSFPVPKASAEPAEISGKKVWVDFGYDAHRPDKITIGLFKEGRENPLETKEIGAGDDGDWFFEFTDYFLYDSEGNKITYSVKELTDVDHYKVTAKEHTEGYNVTNVLNQKPAIELIKEAKSNSSLGEDEIEVGKEIHYTFTITNIGNMPLKNINITDDLKGLSKITYETLNGNDLLVPVDELILQPDDVLVASATYEVTQNDFDKGEVFNHAIVKGTSTVPEPNDDFEEETVDSSSSASVPGHPKSDIRLIKTADQTTISKSDETITFKFSIINTGTTTLNNIKLNDPMLGGNIAIEETTLAPGKSIEVLVEHNVSASDIVAGKIYNQATVTGESSEEEVTSIDDVTIEVLKEENKSTTKDQENPDEPGKPLPKTATNIFTILLIGSMIITIGIFMMNRYKRV